MARTVEIEIKLTGPQEEFMASPAKFTLLSGGYGSAKSTGLQLKTIYRCTQQCNVGWPGMVVASDYGRLSRDVLPGLFSWLDRCQIRYEWMRAAVPGAASRAIRLCNGSVVMIGSADNPASLKGPNLAWIMLEEATLLPRYVTGSAETLWSVLISRLRLPGASNTIDASGTPEGKHCWTCDPGRFETPPDDPAQLPAWARDYRVIRATTGSNIFLPADYEQNLRDNLDPTQIEEKVLGLPTAAVGGAAYYAFDRQKNVTRVRHDPDLGAVRIGLDFNVNPMCAVLCQVRHGRIGVFDEVVQRNSNTPRMAREIVSRLRRLNVRPEEAEVFPDASGRARRTTGGSDFQSLRAAGLVRIKSPPANGRVRDRLLSMNGALHHERFVVDAHCGYLIRDLSRVCVDDYGDIIKTGDLSHISDACGYVVVRLMPVRRQEATGLPLAA